MIILWDVDKMLIRNDYRTHDLLLSMDSKGFRITLIDIIVCTIIFRELMFPEAEKAFLAVC